MAVRIVGISGHVLLDAGKCQGKLLSGCQGICQLSQNRCVVRVEFESRIKLSLSLRPFPLCRIDLSQIQVNHWIVRGNLSCNEDLFLGWLELSLSSQCFS